MKPLEQRSYNFEVEAEETERGSIITGQPIVYGSRTNISGLFDEIIEAGALNNTDLTDVRFLVNHDTSRIPLARSRRNNGNSTMHLTVDETGMSIKVTLDTENNSEARALYSAVQRGDITGMSFMFGIDDEEWENLESSHPTRHIRSISSVVEVSAVTFPAYKSTKIHARSKETLDEARALIEGARKESSMNNLELEKLKTKTLELRYNHNHDSKGRFSSGGGGGGGGGSSRPKPMSDEEIKNYNGKFYEIYDLSQKGINEKGKNTKIVVAGKTKKQANEYAKSELGISKPKSWETFKNRLTNDQTVYKAK